MSQNRYGGPPNPYNQRDDAQSRSYGQPSSNYQQRQYGNALPMGGRDEDGGNVELEPLTQNGQQFGGSGRTVILDECRDLHTGIDQIEEILELELKPLQQRSLDNTDSIAKIKIDKKLDDMAENTMEDYRGLARKLKSIKQKRESGSKMNAQHVDRVDQRLKKSVKDYQNLDIAFKKKLQAQMARQYRIVRPDASPEEVMDAVEDSGSQNIFSQELMQSNRTGQARSALQSVQSRHDEVKKIESQIVELAQLFEEMNALVEQQEAAVTNIEMKGEEVVENMDKGTEQIGVAIKSARNARKWKWWCLGICILIIIIIVVVILIYKFVIQNPPAKAAKRSLLTDFLPLDMLKMRPVVPGVPWTSDNVVPGKAWVPERRALKWAA